MNPLVYLFTLDLSVCFKKYSCSFCSGILYCNFLFGRFVLFFGIVWTVYFMNVKISPQNFTDFILWKKNYKMNAN